MEIDCIDCGFWDKIRPEVSREDSSYEWGECELSGKPENWFYTTGCWWCKDGTLERILKNEKR